MTVPVMLQQAFLATSTSVCSIRKDGIQLRGHFEGQVILACFSKLVSLDSLIQSCTHEPTTLTLALLSFCL